AVTRAYMVDWVMGDGNKYTNQESIEHSYASAGTYSINVKITTDQQCADSTNVTVYVNGSPVPKFSIDEVCEKDSSLLVNLSTIDVGSIIKSTWIIEGATKQLES